jgi:predicted transcriptional regulator of viral defense system
MKKPIPKPLLGRTFSTAEAKACRVSKAGLTRMVQSNRLERVSRGIYRVPHDEDDVVEEAYTVAALRCGIPSAICLLSALEHYQLTDRIPKQTWILVPQSKRVVSKDLKLIRARNPLWNVGIRKTKKYWITTPERTLVECLLYSPKIGSQTALEAIRRALSQKKVKLGNIYDMAKRMGVAHRLRPTIEAFAA